MWRVNLSKRTMLQKLFIGRLEPRNAHLNSEGGSISTTDLLVLTGSESVVSRQAGTFIFHFQNSLALTVKDKEVNDTDTSPFRIKVSIPWLNINHFLTN